MVRVGFPGGPRLDWYDRNPQIAGLTFGGDLIGPHGSTQRAQYTVPTGKKALITSAALTVKRATAATTAAKVEAFMSVPAARIIEVFFYGNNVDSGGEQSIGQNGLLGVGSSLTITTIDSSTGGQVTYRLYGTYVEIDA